MRSTIYLLTAICNDYSLRIKLQVLPRWNYSQQFITTYLHPTLIFDAQSDSHPMSFYVEDPDAIQDMFDEISYNKGVVRNDVI